MIKIREERNEIGIKKIEKKRKISIKSRASSLKG